MTEANALVDLAARAVGGSVVWANDEFFADKSNLVMPGPVSSLDTFGHRGKLYDGWETRRRRSVTTLGAGPDADDRDEAIVRLGAAGVISEVIVDTAFFRGNYPPHIAIEATSAEGYPSVAELVAMPWETLVAKSAALGDTANRYAVTDPHRFTHVRLAIYPDGGVARLRVLGTVVPDPRLLAGTVDLAAVEHGGTIGECSNMFYSSPAHVLQPGMATNMGGGWETARRRGDGNDWLVIGLGAVCLAREVEIDTSFFVGNAPSAVTVRGRLAGGGWQMLLDHIATQPDTRHRFVLEANDLTEVDTVRVDVLPDGGLARVRVRGEVTADGMRAVLARWWDSLPDAHRAKLNAEQIAVRLGLQL